MKQRQIYYRKKGKLIVIEGRSKKKPVLIWTLPSDPLTLMQLLENASFFPKEKQSKINEKIMRLDIRLDKLKKGV